MPYCACASSTRSTAIRISQLFSGATSINALSCGSLKDSSQPNSLNSASAARCSAVAALTSGKDPGLGASGCSYAGAKEQHASISASPKADSLNLTDEPIMSSPGFALDFAPARAFQPVLAQKPGPQPPTDEAWF